jgi:hypothetical protein
LTPPEKRNDATYPGKYFYCGDLIVLPRILPQSPLRGRDFLESKVRSKAFRLSVVVFKRLKPLLPTAQTTNGANHLVKRLSQKITASSGPARTNNTLLRILS